MSIFEEYLPKRATVMGQNGEYKVYICGSKHPKMRAAEKKIYLSHGEIANPKFGLRSDDFLFDLVVDSAFANTTISKEEYDYYYGEQFRKFAHTVLKKLNLEAVHFFSRDVFEATYPFNFERESDDEFAGVKLQSDYHHLSASIDEFFSPPPKGSTINELICHFIGTQVVAVGKKFNRNVAHKVGLYLSGSKEVSTKQLRRILE